MTRPSRAFLFDLDGTLVNAGGAGRRAFERIWQDVLGRPHPFDGVPFSGCTDIEILQGGAMRDLGRPLDAGELARVLERYLVVLPEEVAALTGDAVLPGVRAVLRGLAARPDCLLGLCTGNIEAGARAKLAPWDLNRFFPFGGFGSDAIDRVEMTGHAVRRARERAGDAVEILVIGDSVRDAVAARGNGVRVALVASGKTSADDLRAQAPDLFFPTMADWESVLARFLDLGDGLRCDVSDVARATDRVRRGGVIVYPTSTLYGLGGDATDPSVAARIRGIKGNREAPFVLLAADPQDAFALAADVSETARRLADRHWPGPLTLVLPAADHVPAAVTGPDGTVAVRVDPHPFPRALAKAAGCPLISTSANPAGRPAPGTTDAVDPDIVGACDLFVIDPSPLGGRPSTLVRVVGDRITVLREGALPASAFQAPAPEFP